MNPLLVSTRSNGLVNTGMPGYDQFDKVLAYVTIGDEKYVLDATEKTRKYTGLSYAGRFSGASFSLGYFAECYIDFGFWGMLFPLFLIGIMYGATYRYLMKNSSRNFVFNYSVVGAFFLEFFAFEMDGTYLLGRFLATLVTFIFCIKVFFPWLIDFISVPQPKKAG